MRPSSENNILVYYPNCVILRQKGKILFVNGMLKLKQHKETIT